MDNNINLILAVPPEYANTASSTGLCCAYIIYRIGRGFRLYKADVDRPAGGLMVLNAAGFTGGGPIDALIEEIITECRVANYTGIVLNAKVPTTSALRTLAIRLSNVTQVQNLNYYVSEAFANLCPTSIVMLPSALSGGTLFQRISDAIRHFGTERVALDAELTRMDFILPAADGNGRPLTHQELQNIISEYRPQSFFSQELCAYYFTYRIKNEAHFVLYDNSTSIRRKLSLAAKMGIQNAFLFYPHVVDILDEITKE